MFNFKIKVVVIWGNSILFFALIVVVELVSPSDYKKN
jgi:hypothetical protein